MNAPPRDPLGRRLLQGAAEGASSGLLLWLVLNVVGDEVPGFWPVGVSVVAVGAVLLASARAIASGVVTALAVGVGGLLVGASVGQYVSWETTYARTVAKGEGNKAARVNRDFALAGPGLDGKTVDLKQYRGKVVLVDFWATWCPPCVESLPELLKLYRKYHSKGFEIVGVSLDTSRVRLDKFVQAREMSWPQIMFDEDGKREWESPLAKEHGVQGIPATFLISRDGKMVGRNLRGAVLEESVEALLGAKEGEALPKEGLVLQRKLALGPIVLGLAGLFLGCLGGALLQRRLDEGLAEQARKAS